MQNLCSYQILRKNDVKFIVSTVYPTSDHHIIITTVCHLLIGDEDGAFVLSSKYIRWYPYIRGIAANLQCLSFILK